MDTELRGKRFLITGASGGIGAAIAAALAREGALPVLHWYRNRAGAAAAAQACGAGALLVQADLRDEAQVERMYREATAQRLDGVVVNAGIWIDRHTPLHAMSLEQWRTTMAADLETAFLTCRGFLRHLAADRRDDAAIVLIASTAGLFGEAGHADYAAAKAALAHGLTRSLKNEIVELAPRGRVNCVCPGWVRTPMTESSLEDAQLVARVTATMALQKLATPEDVARAVVYFCSPALSGHVTGSILPVAGGMEGRLLHTP